MQDEIYITPEEDGPEWPEVYAAGVRPAGFRRDFARTAHAARRVIHAEWLARQLRGEGRVVGGAVEINHAVIEGALDLSGVTFKGALSITDTELRGGLNLSFSTFESGACFDGSRFRGAADFRAAHAAGDFRLPLAEFDGPARFEDLHVKEVFNAEGVIFRDGADFSRACFGKKVHFCCALFADGRSRRTEFRGPAYFNDVRAAGPAYFNGARFRGRTAFERAVFGSSAFFNCDALAAGAGLASQPRRETHRGGAPGALPQDSATTLFDGDACFVGLRSESSVAFSGARFAGEADFRRVRIDGTALFDPFEAPGGRALQPVRFGGAADFWNADIKGAARFEAARFDGTVRFQNATIGRDAYFSPQVCGQRALRAVFRRDVNFNNAHVCGSLILKGARFYGRAEFQQTQIDGRADFEAVGLDGADKVLLPFFLRGVSFRGAQVRGTVRFNGAVFVGEADFDRLRAEGGVLFRSYEHTRQRAQPPGRKGEAVLKPVRFGARARFAGARIGNNMEFDSADFTGEANFERVVVGGDVYFRPFKVGASPTRFGSKAIFLGANVGGNVEFSGTVFAADADFTGLQVGGSAYFDAQHHYVEHDGLHYTDPARHIGPACFGGRTQFSGAHLRNEADFKGAKFAGPADFNGFVVEGKLDFERANFAREAVFTTAVFKNAARFGGSRFAERADFAGVTVTGAALFFAAAFRGPAQFSGFLVHGEADFHRAKFAAQADFNGTVVEGRANFAGADFGAEADFSAAQFRNAAHFAVARFGGRANFASISVASTTFFPRADFEDSAIFSSTVFKSEVDFGLARFRQKADFTGTLVEGTASFIGAEFVREIVFRDGNFIALAFCEDPPRHNRGQFKPGLADLGGLTYQRIQVDIFDLLDGVDYTSVTKPAPKPTRRLLSDASPPQLDASLADRLLNEVLDLLPRNRGPWRPQPTNVADGLLYDRQPYTQLINVLRAMGHDTRAEKVYLIQRQRERNRRWSRIRKSFGRDAATGKYSVASFGHGLRKIPFYLLDLLHWRLSNYGVRPIRLVLLSALVIAFGTLMFLPQGAVELRDAEEAAQHLRDIRMQLTPETQVPQGAAVDDGKRRTTRCSPAPGGKQLCDLEWPEALGVSLSQFIPIIELPVGSKWKPADAQVPYAPWKHLTYALYGTLHKGAGAVLVPLLVAALTGILYRREKSNK